MKKIVALALVSLVVGCTTEVVRDETTCVEPKGLYAMTYVNLGGDCGDISDDETIFGEGDDGSSNCRVRKGTSSNDMCAMSASGTCYYTRGQIDMLLTMDLSRDGTNLSGTLTVKAYDEYSALLCSGRYRFEGNKIHD